MVRPKVPIESDREFFKKHIFLIVLAVVAILLNFLLALFFELGRPASLSGAPVYATAGLIGSQIVSIAFVLVLFPAGFVFRFCTTMALALVFVLPLLFGGFVFGFNNVGELMNRIGLLPALVLAFACPFFLGRFFLGWRLHLLGGNSTFESEALSIKSIFISMALVAVAVSVLQSTNERSTDTLGSSLVIVLVAAGVGLLIFLPYSLRVMKSRRHWYWVVGVGLVSFWALFLVLYLASTFWAGVGAGMGAAAGFSLSMASFVIFFGLFLIGLKKSKAELLIRHRDVAPEPRPFSVVPAKQTPDPFA